MAKACVAVRSELCSIAQLGCLVTVPLPFQMSFFFTFKKSRPRPAFFVPRQRNAKIDPLRQAAPRDARGYGKMTINETEEASVIGRRIQ